MKKDILYLSPSVSIVTIQTESPFLATSSSEDFTMGMQDLTYEDIQWN